jgi:cytochrome P450
VFGRPCLHRNTHVRGDIGVTGKVPPVATPFEGDNQNELMAWMEQNYRRFGGIFRGVAYGTMVYVVNEPQYVEHIFRRNWQNYTKGRQIKRIALLLGSGLMVSEGELWKRQRRMTQPAFHDKVIANLTDMITQANLALLERWEHAAQHSTSVNVTRDISLLTLEIMLKAIFSDDYPEVAPHFSILSEEPERSLQFAQMFRALGGVTLQIAAKRQNGAADMLGMMMQARDRDTGRSMSDTQLVNEINTLIVAGHETTASTLNWIWWLVSQHPEVEAKLSDAIYRSHVIEEALRLYPAGWLLSRRARRDDKLGDYFVPATSEIYVSPYIMQREPDIWPDPDRFDPDRFNQSGRPPSLALLPFSIGPRNCIGEGLARLEMQIHLATISSKLRLRYLGDEPVLDLGVNLRSKHDFVMLPMSV